MVSIKGFTLFTGSGDDDDERLSSIDTDATDADTESTSPSFHLSLAFPEHALAAQILQIICVAGALS